LPKLSTQSLKALIFFKEARHDKEKGISTHKQSHQRPMIEGGFVILVIVKLKLV